MIRWLLTIIGIKYCVLDHSTEADVFSLHVCIFSEGANNTQVVAAVKDRHAALSDNMSVIA